MEKKERALEVLIRLKNIYPNVRIALIYSNVFQLLVAAILSAQCTDKKVNEITPGLFKKYPSVKAFAEADIEELQKEVKPTGFYRNKAKNIQGAARKIILDFGGEVPDTMEELITLPGVARKTANVILGVHFKKNVGVTVDTHVIRLSNLLKLTKEKNPEKIERDLMKLIPQKEWEKFSLLIINHGRKVCIARRPQCHECVLNNICPSSQI